jgi:hypothetical protein
MSTTDAVEDRRPLLPRPQFTAHDKQAEAIRSDARYRTLKWGRRAGKNVTAVMDIIEIGRAPWTRPWGADDPRRTEIWWVARSYDQARKHGFEPMKNALPDSWIDGKPTESEPYAIDLVNGVRYEFRTYDYPETLQGAGIDHHVIDEADYMADAIWFDDLDPMLLDTRGSVMFISKPRRPRSYFQTFFDRGESSDFPDHFSSHATSADNPFIAENPEDKRGTVPEYKFQQQYLADLPDAGGQVFSDLDEDLFTAEYSLSGMVNEGVGEAKRDPGECTPPFSVGVDFARHRDYRVTIALDAAGDLSYFSRDQNEGWDTIQSDIEDVHATYPGVVVPDASRDNKIIPDLAKEGVSINPTKFGPKTKRALIDDLATRIETGELSAPDSPKLDQLALELRQMEREVSDGGYTRYHAPDSGYDDCVDSLALAASELDHIATIRRRRERRGDDDDSTSGVDFL